MWREKWSELEEGEVISKELKSCVISCIDLFNSRWCEMCVKNVLEKVRPGNYWKRLAKVQIGGYEN